MIICEGKLSLAFVAGIAKRVHDSEGFTGFTKPSETISANKIIMYEGKLSLAFIAGIAKRVQDSERFTGFL